ncbi:hypothetical protein YYC_00030 [Plasmodium yoelii 17X]|uniref:Uncharacterized protein n=1 Tax=Plasmodium yoelii 17X TaxID=1323249 RepID=V7PVA5_PLAYE|nr:hypothetical protein YYC_00030 [Plasmodium yoelii 17X]
MSAPQPDLKCRVNNIKERYYNKFHFSTKNSDYNNISLNTKTTNETKNNNYDFSKPKYKIINSQPKRNLCVFGYNRGKRKRIITERLMKEYNISDKDLEMIEKYDDVTGR